MNAVIPGIYVTEQQYALNPLQIDSECLAAFAGITEKGPVNEPVKVKSFDQYMKTFGSFDTAGVLPFSVYSYFKCGGKECIIVRVAHEPSLKTAEIKIPCESGSVSFYASSPGKWGNYLSARVWHEHEKAGIITGVDNTDGSWIDIEDHSFSPGDTISVACAGREYNKQVVQVEDNKIYFDTPVKILSRIKNYDSAIKVSKTFCSVSLSCKNKTENFQHLSVNPHNERYYFAWINERSTLCRVEKNGNPSILSQTFLVQAQGGSDGIAELSPADFIGFYKGPLNYAGIGCFESSDDISLIAAPDVMWFLSAPGKSEEEKLSNIHAVQESLITQAERFRGRFAVLDIPNCLSSMKTVSWAKKIDTAFASAYFPFIDVIDPLDPVGAKTVRIPPSGAVCGCIALTDAEKGIFHAPANTLIQGAVGVSDKVTDEEYEFLYSAGINLLKYFPGKGIKIWGARTLSSDPNWRYINVRRTFSQICSSIKRGTQWAVFETNDKNLRKRLVRQVSGFLLDLWMKGYLAGSTAEQGFYVRCDEELNPPENIDNGILTFEVGIAIVKPTEFFTIMITAEKDGASVYIQKEG